MKCTIIKEWLVKLQGASYDLDELESIFVFPLVMVINKDGAVYLKSTSFNSIKKPGEVLQEAKRLLELC